MTIAGIDGCKGGWIAVEVDAGTRLIASHYVRDLADYLTGPDAPEIAAIDIPIGLTDSGPRECDPAVRAMIQPRGSSVFPAPIRPALAARTRLEAHNISVDIQGKGVGAQGFAICDKIREVDNLLAGNPGLKTRLFEIHPELCFAAMNSPAGPVGLANPKKSLLGARERLALIEEEFGPGAFEQIRATHRQSTVQDDDILDALAAAWTALRIEAGNAQSIPNFPPIDSQGLPMAMWY